MRGAAREQKIIDVILRDPLVAHKVDKQNLVARSNEHCGIPDRRFITNESKARAVTQSQLDQVRDEYVRMSLELQQAFGLRREEAMKFQPSFADRAITSRERGHEREVVTAAYPGR